MNYIQNSYYTKMIRKNEKTYWQRQPATNIFEALLEREKGIVRIAKMKRTHTESIEAYTDTLEISPATETRMRDEYIGKTLESGEPLKGISFDDFKFYYIRNQGICRSGDNMQRLYSQAQKGWKVSCAEREWRADPDFIMTPPMFGSPELTEDREAAFEKFRNGGELTGLERDLLSTFPDANEGSKRVNEVIQELGRKAARQQTPDKIAELSPDTEKVINEPDAKTHI